MAAEETNDMYMKQAQELEELGQFKQAEDLYIAIGQVVKQLPKYNLRIRQWSYRV